MDHKNQTLTLLGRIPRVFKGMAQRAKARLAEGRARAEQEILDAAKNVTVYSGDRGLEVRLYFRSQPNAREFARALRNFKAQKDA
jgi:hypothetical protein